MIKAWIEAMRLRTLPVSVAGVVCGSAYAIGAGSFEVAPALLCLVFAILCQIASNFANEYYDYRAGRDRAGREGPRRGVTEGDITAGAMRNAVFITLAIATAVGMTLTLWGGLWLVAVGVLVGVGALAYSTGPYPLSTHCLGEVAVVLFFGVVPVNLTYYLQTLQWSMPVALASLAIGLMGANVLIVNNTRDIPDDRAVGKHTLATAFGIRAMTILYAANALAATALCWGAWKSAGAFTIAPALYIVASVFIAVMLGKLKGAHLTPLLGMTSILMFAYSVCLLLRFTLS